MKWQRARMLVNQPNRLHAGREVWVRVHRPHPFCSDTTGAPLFTGYFTNERGVRDVYAVPADEVELLPEFSDTEFPDEENRQ